MSGTLEGYHFINGQNPWDIRGEMHNSLTDDSSDLISDVEYKNNHLSFNTCDSSEACLVLRVPPENRFRYRYDTEMSGTHGSLQGIRRGREKSVPTVELINYPFEALIRVTLVTCQENEHYPHPHSLFVKEKLYQKKIYENHDEKRLTKTGHYSDPHYIRVGRSKNDYIARFEGMCIINSKKENFHSSVREKLQRSCDFRHGLFRNDPLKADEDEALVRKVEAAVSAVDVDFVSLCFEAFREENGKLFPICGPVYSEPIGNAKSAKTGKLKISRINKCSGSCKGGDEIWLLVEKINKKGLVVKFSEEYNGKVIWESCIEGDDLILHHQYAIIFKTPPYRDSNITSEVEVLMRLERTTQPNQLCDYSEPITFVYEPSKSKSSKGDNLYRKESILAPFKQFQTKRPRTDSSSTSPFSHQNKRRPDDLELEGMDFEDIEQLLFEGKDSFELDQAWGKFNTEEFLRFISSDDMDEPMQRDGIAQNNKSRRDLYKLYLLYSKLDENDIKKLTDQISNFRVSKKESGEGNAGMEKNQVKDAASTLLTLKSKAMNNNSSFNNNNNGDITMICTSGANKTELTEKILPPNKTESLNKILETYCEPEVEGINLYFRGLQVHVVVVHPIKKFLKTEIVGENSISKKISPKPKKEMLNASILIRIGPESQSAQSPVHMSVIKFNLSKSKCSKSGREINDFELSNEDLADLSRQNHRASDKESFCSKVIKKEKNLLDGLINAEKLEKVFTILNSNGSWRNLAEAWNHTDAVPIAKKSSNPAKYIFEYIKKIQGFLDIETLRDSLEAIKEKEALELFNEILREDYDSCNKDL